MKYFRKKMKKSKLISFLVGTTILVGGTIAGIVVAIKNKNKINDEENLFNINFDVRQNKEIILKAFSLDKKKTIFDDANAKPTSWNQLFKIGENQFKIVAIDKWEKQDGVLILTNIKLEAISTSSKKNHTLPSLTFVGFKSIKNVLDQLPIINHNKIAIKDLSPSEALQNKQHKFDDFSGSKLFNDERLDATVLVEDIIVNPDDEEGKLDFSYKLNSFGVKSKEFHFELNGFKKIENSPFSQSVKKAIEKTIANKNQLVFNVLKPFSKNNLYLDNYQKQFETEIKKWTPTDNGRINYEVKIDNKILKGALQGFKTIKDIIDALPIVTHSFKEDVNLLPSEAINDQYRDLTKITLPNISNLKFKLINLNLIALDKQGILKYTYQLEASLINKNVLTAFSGQSKTFGFQIANFKKENEIKKTNPLDKLNANTLKNIIEKKLDLSQKRAKTAFEIAKPFSSNTKEIIDQQEYSLKMLQWNPNAMGLIDYEIEVAFNDNLNVLTKINFKGTLTNFKTIKESLDQVPLATHNFVADPNILPSEAINNQYQNSSKIILPSDNKMNFKLINLKLIPLDHWGILRYNYQLKAKNYDQDPKEALTSKVFSFEVKGFKTSSNYDKNTLLNINHKDVKAIIEKKLKNDKINNSFAFDIANPFPVETIMKFNQEAYHFIITKWIQKSEGSIDYEVKISAINSLKPMERVFTNSIIGFQSLKLFLDQHADLMDAKSFDQQLGIDYKKNTLVSEVKDVTIKNILLKAFQNKQFPRPIELVFKQLLPNNSKDELEIQYYYKMSKYDDNILMKPVFSRVHSLIISGFKKWDEYQKNQKLESIKDNKAFNNHIFKNINYKLWPFQVATPNLKQMNFEDTIYQINFLEWKPTVNGEIKYQFNVKIEGTNKIILKTGVLKGLLSLENIKKTFFVKSYEKKNDFINISAKNSLEALKIIFSSNFVKNLNIKFEHPFEKFFMIEVDANTEKYVVDPENGYIKIIFNASIYHKMANGKRNANFGITILNEIKFYIKKNNTAKMEVIKNKLKQQNWTIKWNRPFDIDFSNDEHRKHIINILKENVKLSEEEAQSLEVITKNGFGDYNDKTFTVQATLMTPNKELSKVVEIFEFKIFRNKILFETNFEDINFWKNNQINNWLFLELNLDKNKILDYNSNILEFFNKKQTQKRDWISSEKPFSFSIKNVDVIKKDKMNNELTLAISFEYQNDQGRVFYAKNSNIVMNGFLSKDILLKRSFDKKYQNYLQNEKKFEIEYHFDDFSEKTINGKIKNQLHNAIKNMSWLSKEEKEIVAKSTMDDLDINDFKENMVNFGSSKNFNINLEFFSGKWTKYQFKFIVLNAKMGNLETLIADLKNYPDLYDVDVNEEKNRVSLWRLHSLYDLGKIIGNRMDKLLDNPLYPKNIKSKWITESEANLRNTFLDAEKRIPLQMEISVLLNKNESKKFKFFINIFRPSNVAELFKAQFDLYDAKNRSQLFQHDFLRQAKSWDVFKKRVLHLSKQNMANYTNKLNPNDEWKMKDNNKVKLNNVEARILDVKFDGDVIYVKIFLIFGKTFGAKIDNIRMDKYTFDKYIK